MIETSHPPPALAHESSIAFENIWAPNPWIPRDWSRQFILDQNKFHLHLLNGLELSSRNPDLIAALVHHLVSPMPPEEGALSGGRS